MIKALRNNIGSIIAFLGFFLLCVVTFGDLGNVLTEQYWKNVMNNITGIGFLTISLTLIQVSIKQGISEQALQKGLNTENTTKKMKEHRELISEKPERMKYLPYFLQSYNDRQTSLKKREFLVTNNFKSEEILYKSKRKMAIRKYKKIRILLTPSAIKWATTDIVYKKNGQVASLAEHRKIRAMKGVIRSAFNMIAVALLTKGLFFDGDSGTPIKEKFIKLGTYIIVIAMTSILSIVKEYEKGAFGVPNELEEINEIWREFHDWEVPQHIIDEVEEIDRKEVKDEKTESGNKRRADLSSEQEKGESVSATCTDNSDSVPCFGSGVLLADDRK